MFAEQDSSDGDDEISSSTPSVETKGKLTQRHKMEIRDLKNQITKMTAAVPKKDKKARAELDVQIKLLEDSVHSRHKLELLSFDEKQATTTTTTTTTTTNKVSSLMPTSSPSSVSKKQEKKNKRIKEEEDRLKSIAELNKNSINYRTNEEDLILKKLAPINMCLKHIQADGNCLYAAIADQIRLLHLPGPSTSKELREEAAKYMLSHPSSFIPFLDSDSAQISDLKEYCKELTTTSKWGGQLEITALSHSLRTPIIIHSADTPDIQTGEEYSSTDSTTPSSSLHLSYHKHAYALGAHYNSVVPLVSSSTST
eukprot:TRINITY_DN8853_c0_g1_i1.p1 TRINITY_DN8853_c0_g1~~TRINITY_DN8853_c0_g1_i1.p1  ORF type:complete len:311 (-),score=88.36 TRINITY_DN8853_c0_g1_i1:47-979(-)